MVFSVERNYQQYMDTGLVIGGMDGVKFTAKLESICGRKSSQRLQIGF